MEETFRGMTFQAAPVSKPLGSVKRICAAGHRVVFDEDGSYIESPTTGDVNMLCGTTAITCWTCGSYFRGRPSGGP